MKSCTNGLALLALLALTSLGPVRAQITYTPVAVTGYTDDVVADGAGPAASSTTSPADQGVAGNRFCYVAPNYVSPTGVTPVASLPGSRVVSSVLTPGLTFQLAPYNGPNSLRIAGTSLGSLTLTTPQATQSVWVAAASGNGESAGTPVTMTVLFTDNTSQTFAVSVPDWYGGTGFAIQGVTRVNRDTDVLDNRPGDPRIYQFELPLLPANYGRLVRGVQFSKTQPTNATILNVFNGFAITLSSACALPAGTLSATATSVCRGTAVTLAVVPQAGAAGGGYAGQWQASTDGGTTWADIAGATTQLYTATPQVSTRYRFRATCGVTQAFIGPLAVTVLVPTAAVAYPDTTYCRAGQSPTPVVSPAGGTFSASAGLVLNAATGVVDLAASTPGRYLVTYAVNTPCPASSSVFLRVAPLPTAFSYACPPFYQNGAAVAPSAVPVGGGRFSASPAGLGLNASTGAVDLTNSGVGNYTITFTSAAGCTSTTAFPVVDKLVFPNVITPNGDGQNDALRPRLANVTGYHLVVYNRWGRQVYEGRDAAQGWTAADNSSGYYYYHVDYTDCTGVFHTLKSWIEVVK